MWVVLTDEATMDYSVDYYIRGIYSSKEQAEERAEYLSEWISRPIDVVEIPADTDVKMYIGGYTE